MVLLLADQSSKDETVQFFQVVELTVFVEFVHHLVGIQNLKRHFIVNTLARVFVLLGVLTSVSPNVSKRISANQANRTTSWRRGSQ
jgi:hypothetical protein